MDLTDLNNLNNMHYPRFFIKDGVNYFDGNGKIIITGTDALHIGTVLRFKKNDIAVISDNMGTDFYAVFSERDKECVVLDIIEKMPNRAEPDIYVRLFQCIPKSDKMELVIQKATELGVSEITPVISKRCVSRPDEKNQSRNNKKWERFQKIAEEAAKQSGRGKIPVVNNFTTFNAAVSQYKKTSLGIILYERGGLNINEIFGGLNEKPLFADIFIGSEGGFEEFEVNQAENAGINKIYLGRRVLRTETAPIAIISVLMNLTGNL